jgi:integrase
MGAYRRKYTTGRELGVAQQHVDPQWRYRREGVELPDGRTITVSGTAKINTKAGAEQAERDAIALEIDKARFPEKYAANEEPEPAPSEAITFARFWRERYLPTLTTDAPSTIEAKRIHFDRHLRRPIGDLTLDGITRRVLDTLKASLMANTKDRNALSAKTTRNVLGTLRHALSMAVEWGDLPALPRWPKFKIEDSEWDFLTQDEARALLAAARDERDRLLLWFAVATGARAGEQLALKWSDITWTEGAESVRFRRSYTHGHLGSTKSKRHRSVPLPPGLADALQAARNEAGARELVFTDDSGRMMRIGQLHECLWRTLKRAGLREIRWHDLRHSFASHLVAAGVPLNVVQARMGHSTILMTMRYSHLAPEQHRTFVDVTAGQRVDGSTGSKRSKTDVRFQ